MRVKRYEILGCEGSGCVVWYHRVPGTGEVLYDEDALWCLHEDVAALEAENERLRREVAEARTIKNDLAKALFDERHAPPF